MSLQRFILKRTLLVIPIMFGVSVITFALVYLTPGDPVDVIAAGNPNMGAGEQARLRAEMGLDRPIHVQYWDWISGALQGDFGDSYRTNRPVSALIQRRLPETVALGLFGWAIGLIIAIPTGVYAAVRKGSLGDDVSRFVALFGISIPNFWLGVMLITIFASSLGLWPILSPREPLWHPDMLYYLILPGLTIGTASSAVLMRIMRSSMVEEMNKEYVTAARAKGLPERTVVVKHVLRNSLISVVTVAAFLTANIFAGSIVVEVVFAWPGLGREFYQAILQREVNTIMAITLLTGVVIVIMNFLADIVYALLDPRIRY